MTKCIITGCGMKTPTDGDYWGDLWEEGNCWIFNATTEAGSPVEPEQLYSQKILTLMTTQYFERRGVFVVSKSTARLNDLAKAYISKDPTL